ncbi:ABC transporter substrate-binding protein [Papillibacter cinnamivorans]|uniref:ABC-type branched-chain amino acid transport system, substrate-binding protein n=1 Tax=Papillibacter cinnamivorans DSM 12816 TaxID=1122930 RepID=A0A1W1YV84_9FIRM|nr:ABC transporter substrate-binding protein [Papillibacter cinnamivorans]SMC40046.1 ABC-type branched-chain amino acid transport system, substrate-binding protein [Papillibacter cinnamivorans DSM 12816]
MKRFLSLLLAALMVLALTACGGGSGSATATPTAAPTEDAASSYVQGVTDTEVKIANTAATSGAYAPVGVPFLAGIQAYLDMVNEAGGIDGRKITFLHKDDEFDPVKGKAFLQEMVEDEKVFAIVGHFGTPVVGATVADLKTYGIPSVYFATGIGQLYAENATTNDEGYNLFPVQPIYKTEGKIMVARAVGNFGAKKIGVIYTSDDAGKDLLWGCEAMAKELNVELVSEQVAAGAADVSAAVTAIKNDNVDFIVGAAIQATIPTIIKELAAQDVNKDVITTYVNVAPAIADQIKDVIQGKFDVYGSGWVSYEGERADALAEYQAHIADDYDNNAYAQTGWIAAYFFCEGLRRLEGQPVTWASYMEALQSAPIQNPFGGEIDYANGLRAGTQEMNLSKVDSSSSTGWTVVYPLENVDTILGK